MVSWENQRVNGLERLNSIVVLVVGIGSQSNAYVAFGT